MQTHNIDYLPGAAELGDFDATSTSIALSPVGEQQMLPPEAMLATFERYWKDFAARRTDKSWDAYTPYEWRNLGTFIRLRWRDRAMELIDFLMNDRRPHRVEPVGRGRRPRAAQVALRRRHAAWLGRFRLRTLAARHVRVRAAGGRNAGADGRRAEGVDGARRLRG